MNKCIALVLVSIFFLTAQKITPLSGKTRSTEYNLAPEILAVLQHNPDPWFSEDKFYHLTACAVIPCLTFHLYTTLGNGDVTKAKVYSVSATALVGIGKEICDKKKKNHFSWKDLFWDSVGLAIGYFLFID